MTDEELQEKYYSEPEGIYPDRLRKHIPGDPTIELSDPSRIIEETDDYILSNYVPSTEMLVCFKFFKNIFLITKKNRYSYFEFYQECPFCRASHCCF